MTIGFPWSSILLSTALWAAVVCPGFAGAQVSISSSELEISSASQPGQPVTLSGVVLNANTNQPVARALVQAGSHAVLTEHDGKFQFTDASGSSELLRVTKPGYYDGLDQGFSFTRITFGANADPIKVYLYPEALVTGTMTAPNGDPLPGIHVQALRKTGDESGARWMMGGQTSTNADGEFRLPLSPGDYVIETRYMSDRPMRQQAVLPTLTPDPSSGGQSGVQTAIHLDSGAEQHLDLRPPLRTIHDVHIQIDGAQGQGFPQVEAHLPNGLSFFPGSRQGGTPGDVIVMLPTGSYLLTTSSGERDGSSYGQATVTVGDSDMTGVVLHMAKSLPMPVEVLVDASSSTTTTSDNQPPSAKQLGLHFIRTDSTPSMTNSNVWLHAGSNEATTISFPPGRYRLFAQPISQWFIESATVAGTDLLTQSLDVESGGSPSPLRITVSNHSATLKGTVKLDGSPTGNCWVYLVSTTPSVTPVLYATTANDGSFSRSIPPGSYRAVAFETHHLADFSDSATLELLAPYMKSVTVTPGETATLDLDAIPTLELKR
jgi:hypothetical protein